MNVTESGSAQPVPSASVAELLEGLRLRGETVATAESLTAGLLCASLTSVAGASEVIRGGLIVYATDLKSSLADVDDQLLAAYGAIHPEVAGQLAAAARSRCGADWGIGLTGVAGPDPQEGARPGTVYLGIASVGEPVVRRLELHGDRTQIRNGAVRCAVELLGELIRY